MKRLLTTGCAIAGLMAMMPFTTPVSAQQAANAGTTQSVDPHANETPAQRDARMKWWREARFGMFIHWGLYAVPAGVYDGRDIGGLGEWIMRGASIPVATYAAYAPQFDPEQFNADQWVSYAKAAGMRYIVMSAKHHDGFAMYPTKVDDFNIDARTPFKRDPIGEMAAACRKAGIKFGIYYSQNFDWHHPGGGIAGTSWDPAQQGDFAAYVKNVSAPQVKELITRYHPAVLWWDIPGPFTPDEVREMTVSFPQDPELIYNNRLGGGVPGDTDTPEQHIPATGIKGDWETCMTINDTWGYKSTDTNFKSADTLLHNLIDIASKGGNYLLNVGPTSQGVVPAPEVQRLQDMGAWMKANGDSIYATTASPYKRLSFDGRCTVKGNTLYLNVFTWPINGLTLTGLQTDVKGAKVLATGRMLLVTKAADGTLSIGKPDAPDPDSTAIALTLSGPPVVIESETLVAPLPSGGYALNAADANVTDEALQMQGNGDAANLGYWSNAQDAPHWKLRVPAASAGAYQVQLSYSCAPGNEGSTFVVQVDGAASGVTGTIGKTAGWDDFQTVTLPGSLKLVAGTHVVSVVPVTKPGQAVMNLRRLTLLPAK